MKQLASIFLAAAATLAALPSSVAAAEPAAPSPEITPQTVLATMKRVADWQLVQEPKHATDDWTFGALYAGMMALSQVADDAKYHDAMMAMGQKHEWKPARRIYHADDHCVCQTYLELFMEHRDPAMIGPTRERFDFILAHPKTGDLHFNIKGASDRWAWCDALFMGPPAWLRLYAVTGEKKYLDFMDREWKATSDFLYDKEEHLYFRDSNYFEKREANGKKVFWSRGNGWVIAGLARLLEDMPADYPDRARHVALFKEMAGTVAPLQGQDGSWRASLLDPASLPNPETSGTGFFIYSLAWGINHGLLDRATFEPAVRRGWSALVKAMQPDGMLGWVQRIGDKPGATSRETTEVYGVGALLLAGSEVYRLKQ